MGYDISMIDSDGNTCKVQPHTYCGSYKVSPPSDEAEIGITYNYSKFYRETIDEEEGVRWLYGKTGRECGTKLLNAVDVLGVYRGEDEDYWSATPGNAGRALMVLFKWAEGNLDGVFRGD